jgi:hypothetical protein
VKLFPVVAMTLLSLALPLFAATPTEIYVRETTVVPAPGATAAYPIDESIASATLVTTGVAFSGRAPGTTQIVVITTSGQSTIPVTVKRRAVQSSALAAASRNGGQLTLGYASSGQQLRAAVELHTEAKGRTSALHVETVTAAKRDQHESERSRIATPSISYETKRGARSLTLFDRTQSVSPLTLDGIVIRGIHYEDSQWRAFAGATAYAAFDSFLLPTDRQLVLGASRSVRLSSTSTVSPALVFVKGSNTAESIASLVYDYRNGNTQAAVEAAFGGRLGGSARFTTRQASSNFDAQVVYRPRGFVAVGPAEGHGLFADAAWDAKRGAVSLSSRGSISHYDEERFAQSIDSMTSSARWQLSRVMAAEAGASYVRVSGASGNNSSITIPAGIHFDFARSGISLIGRYAQSSSTNRGGIGFRLAARASSSRLYTTANIDAQQYAPTLSLIYHDQPELANALEQHGIAATSPSDIAYARRTNRTLIELGFVEGVNVELSPRRLQAAWELGWIGRDARQQLRLRLQANRNEGVSRTTETRSASLSWSRRITATTDVFATASVWQIEQTGMPARSLQSIDGGIRQRFNGVPSLLGGSGTIRGTVFIDDDITGIASGRSTLEGAEVELDGVKKVVTARDGRYAFDRVANGAHRIAVRAPRVEHAYFTTPARVEASTGDVVDFGVSVTPARVIGALRSDAGIGIGGVTILLVRGAVKRETVTASDGTFDLVAAPGEWELQVATETVPAGYSLLGTEARSVVLNRDTPVRVELTIRANRAISGRVLNAGASGVTLLPSGRVVTTDVEGHFSFRGLPAGEITVVAEANGTRWQKTLQLPVGPASLREIELGPEPASIEVATASDAPVMAEYGFVVQLGACRDLGYAQVLQSQAKAQGVDAKIVPGRALQFVRVGPFASNSEATATAALLERAGIQAFVLSLR